MSLSALISSCFSDLPFIYAFALLDFYLECSLTEAPESNLGLKVYSGLRRDIY